MTNHETDHDSHDGHDGHDGHEHTITTIGISGSFTAGPLDGAGFMLWVPPDQDLTDLRVTLPTDSGTRDVYLYDRQPDPASLEAVLRYIGTVGFAG